jgi:two-component system LytT family sensor kinase
MKRKTETEKKEWKRQLKWLLIFTILIFVLAGLGFGYYYRNYVTSFSYSFIISFAIFIFLALIYFFIFPKIKKYSRGKRLMLATILSLIGVYAGLNSAFLILSFISGHNFLRNLNSFYYWIINLGIFIFISSLANAVGFYIELKEKDLLEERLKTLAVQSELKALKAQINPHFLFNTLNTISNLINTNPKKAERTIEKLAQIFRYTLVSSEKEFVTLRDELDFIDSYLEIEKERFEDKLNVKKSISPEMLDISIPNLIIQPLIENAIKHGANRKGEVEIEMSIFTEGNVAYIEVKDMGSGIPEEDRENIYEKGTGLKNINERLKKIYGKNYGLAFKENKLHGTIVSVQLPYSKRIQGEKRTK